LAQRPKMGRGRDGRRPECHGGDYCRRLWDAESREVLPCQRRKGPCAAVQAEGAAGKQELSARRSPRMRAAACHCWVEFDGADIQRWLPPAPQAKWISTPHTGVPRRRRSTPALFRRPHPRAKIRATYIVNNVGNDKV